ncbi:MAG: PrsW family glutamic-type intramembrane protease [Minisyncoccia bacterium]
MTLTTLGYVFLGGLLPAFIWLYFLLQEDAAHPEPKTMIALAFVAGMAAVPFVIPLEQFARASLVGGLPVLTAWALIEEVMKYGVAAVFVFWRPAVDEAPDYVIYMITVALGFAAAENMLFLFTPVSGGNLASSIFTGDIRFIGSTLLHVFASAAIGFSLAFSDLSRPTVRVAAAACGLILAIALHTAFNALIITQGTSTTLAAVFLVWVAAVVFFAAFEVLKFFQYRNTSTNLYQS